MAAASEVGLQLNGGGSLDGGGGPTSDDSSGSVRARLLMFEGASSPTVARRQKARPPIKKQNSADGAPKAAPVRGPLANEPETTARVAVRLQHSRSVDAPDVGSRMRNKKQIGEVGLPKIVETAVTGSNPDPEPAIDVTVPARSPVATGVTGVTDGPLAPPAQRRTTLTSDRSPTVNGTAAPGTVNRSPPAAGRAPLKRLVSSPQLPPVAAKPSVARLASYGHGSLSSPVAPEATVVGGGTGPHSVEASIEGGAAAAADSAAADVGACSERTQQPQPEQSTDAGDYNQLPTDSCSSSLSSAVDAAASSTPDFGGSSSVEEESPERKRDRGDADGPDRSDVVDVCPTSADILTTSGDRAGASGLPSRPDVPDMAENVDEPAPAFVSSSSARSNDDTRELPEPGDVPVLAKPWNLPVLPEPGGVPVLPELEDVPELPEPGDVRDDAVISESTAERQSNHVVIVDNDCSTLKPVVKRRDRSAGSSLTGSVFKNPLKRSEKVDEDGLMSPNSDDVFDIAADTTRDEGRAGSSLTRVRSTKDDGGSDEVDGREQNDDDASDDDDEGCYDESRRISMWKFIGNDTPAVGAPSAAVVAAASASSSSSCDASPGSSGASPSARATVSVTQPPSAVVDGTKLKQRSISVDAAAVRSTRTIQRHNTLMTYQKLSERESMMERSLCLVKKEDDKSFGFHLIGTGPTIVSTVEPGSPADLAGVLVGDKLLAVNDLSVLTSSQADIYDLVTSSSNQLKLNVAAGILSRDIPVHSGYVQYMDDRKTFKKWKRRWAEVKHDGFMYFYKKEEDKSPLSALCVFSHVVVKAPECGREFVFKLVKYGSKVVGHYCQCLSAADMIRWVSSINNVTAHKTMRPGMWLDISSHNVGVAALSIRDPECYGYLSKVGNHYRTWRRRYCVLKYACLYYYREPSSSTAKGVVHLHGYTVEEDPTARKFGFQLIPPQFNMRHFQFGADNENDMKRWMTAMKTSIGKWVAVASSPATSSSADDSI